jgi:hypothetical protein
MEHVAISYSSSQGTHSSIHMPFNVLFLLLSDFSALRLPMMDQGKTIRKCKSKMIWEWRG